VDVQAGPGDDGPVELVPVFESLDPIRGMLVRGLLEAEGLEVLAKGEGLGPYRTGPVILFVIEEASGRARELIAAAEDGSLELASDERSSGSADGLSVERSAD
jgi:hypothetical protein